MMKALVSTIGLSHEDWLEWRRNGIGGSDAGIICGVNKYKSPVELYMEKVGLQQPSTAGEAAFWGSRLEGIIRDEFSVRTGLKVIQVPYILQSRELSFMIADVDGVTKCPTHGKCIVEIKTASAYKADEWEDSIPYSYLLQVQHYMSVVGYDGAYVCVLIGGQDFRWRYIPRDERLISMLIEREADFWNHVSLGIVPEMDGSDSCAKYLSSRYPASTPLSKIQLPDSAVALINQYNTAREELDRLTARKQEAENKLKAMLGDNAVGYIGDNVISWSNVSKESFDSKTFKSEQPTLHSQYTKQSSYRRFSVKSA